MAINPATLKTIAKVVTTVSDERTRWVILIACLIPFIIILLVLSSPFAIFISVTNEEANAVSISISDTMDSLKKQFEEKIREEEKDETVDEVHTVIIGSEDNSIIDNSVDVLIAYSIKINVVDDGAKQVAILSESQVNKLNDVYWDMNTITSKIDTFKEKKTYTKTDEEGNKITKMKIITKKIKTIYIDCLSAEEIANKYNFNYKQLRVLEEMKKIDYGELFRYNKK